MKPLTFLLAGSFILVPALTFAQDARKIADDATKTIEFKSLEMVSTLKINDGKGNVRSRQVANATRQFDQVTKTLIRFLAPADVKGTAMLIYDNDDKPDDLWIYLPSLRKSRRIVSSEKGKSFMGSEFSNADMSKPNLIEFDFTLMGSETLDSKDCWMIEAKPKNKAISEENGYSRKVSYIEKTTNLTLKADYYDFSNQLFKTMTFSDYRKQSNGKYFAFRMEMKNHLNKRFSEIIVDKFQLGSNLDESSFAVSALGN